MEKPILAIVVPCFNEEEILQTTFGVLQKILKELISKNKISENSYISFIDDGSSDNTWSSIKGFDAKGIKFNKNYGHQIALYAGLVENEADIYITIDADFQDDISLIEAMTDKYLDGFEIVYGVIDNRETDSFFKRFCANSYYFITSFLKKNTIPNHADFRLTDKNAVNQLKNYKTKNIYLRGFFANLNLKSTRVYYKREKRIGGKSKYNIIKLLKLAFSGFCFDNKTQSDLKKPLYIVEEKYN